MTILSHEDLKAAVRHPALDQRLVVMPLLDDDSQIGPASLDVRLGTQFRLLRRIVEAGLDPGDATQNDLESAQIEVTVGFGEPFWLHPGQFVLGSTLEFLRFPRHLSGYVVGRSSWGRAGLLVATAILVQPGFAGALTLELVNHGESPIALYAGSRVAQLTIHSLTHDTERPYAGKYAGPTGPEVSRLASERKEVRRLKSIGTHLGGRNAGGP